MSQPAVPLPGRLDRIKVLAAESTRMNDQLLAGALAQDRQLEVIGVEPKPPSILAAVAQQRPHMILISSALRESEPMRLVESAGEPVLSKREQDVVRGVAEGLSNREIGRCLGLTEHTVKNYQSSAKSLGIDAGGWTAR
jgi:DNA-binding CsgD family transcriptional regulator